jgi:regulatory protein SWI6
MELVHGKVRQNSTALSNEKRQLDELQAQVSEKTDLERKTANLRRSASEYRARLSQSNGKSDSTLRTLPNVRIGEADKGLEIDLYIDMDPATGTAVNGNTHLTPAQMSAVASLPPAPILRARMTAYKHDIENLTTNAKKLKGKSGDLEQRYRQIIALCTGVEESKVDESLGSLLQAVASEGKDEGNVDLDERIKAFLELVRGEEE